MFKLLSVALLLTFSFQGDCKVYNPTFSKENVLTLSSNSDPKPKISSIWLEHLKDFAALVDIDKVVGVVFAHITEPEVLDFITFVMSEEFRKTIWEFESIAEFKEAFKFLADKGYDVETAINLINQALELPPFEKPKVEIIKTGKSMTGLIEDLLEALPLEEFKKLFETKLETSPEIADLFETINSPEFMDIMKRMSKNPKFEEFKKTFEKYGFDFKYLCTLAKEILGEYYQGLFCENH